MLQVLPAIDSGGVERGTAEIATALTAAGWNAIVASEGGAMERELSRATATHVTLPLATKNPLAIYRNAARLVRLIEQHGVDLVHARSRAPAWSAFIAARRTRRPFVTTFHGAYREGPLKHWYNAVMAKGDRVIAISEFIAEHVRARFPAAAERVVTIPRGVDMNIFDPSRVSGERQIQLSQSWHLRDGASVVFMPGRLSRGKGQRTLIEAMAGLADGSAVCIIAGDDRGRETYRNELEALIDARGLRAKVGLVGPCRDISAGYMLADVVISASTHPEGFGRTIVEAQAMGRPVVATNHGGAPEGLIAGETGWLVPPSDAGAMTAAIEQALALSPGARANLALKARDNVQRHFTLELMCESTLEVYRGLLAGA